MLKRLLCAVSLMLAGSAAYIALPFWTAFSIREAVKSGNTAYLDAKIEWPSVRVTLGQSLASHTLNLPEIIPAAAATPAQSPGMWQRFKAYAGKRAIDKFVASYVSAEGFSQLHRLRTLYREKVKGEIEDPASLTRLERMRRAWARIIRAEFHSMTEFEIEQRDRFDASRSYVGLMRLRGFEWKLTELRMRSHNVIAPLASAR